MDVAEVAEANAITVRKPEKGGKRVAEGVLVGLSTDEFTSTHHRRESNDE